MIDVALTPAQVRPADVTVVVDVLRATSTVTQALAAGYQRVLCAASLERACDLRHTGRVLAGERHCIRPEGFDQGNSPFEVRRPRAEELVLGTTNGAPAIVAAAQSSHTVLLGSVLNLAAVVEVLLENVDPPEREIQILCAGTDGGVALEDTYLAGRLSSELPGPRTDAALVAESTARAFPGPFVALSASADARVLRANGLEQDIVYCARESEVDVVPVVAATTGDVAAVVAADQLGSRGLRHAAVDALATVKR